MNFDEMLALLEEGGCHTGSFDEGSLKSLATFHDELTGRDATLGLKEYKNRLRACCTSLNVRALIVWQDRNGVWHYLCEIGRVYRRMVGSEMREEHRWGFKPYGISETRKRGETPLDAIHRAFYEEYEIAGIERFIVNCPGPDVYDIHESKVYREVIREVYTQWFVFYAPHQFHPGGILTEPDGSEVRVAWFSENSLSQKGLLEVLMVRDVAPFPRSMP